MAGENKYMNLHKETDLQETNNNVVTWRVECWEQRKKKSRNRSRSGNPYHILFTLFQFFIYVNILPFGKAALNIL